MLSKPIAKAVPEAVTADNHEIVIETGGFLHERTGRRQRRRRRLWWQTGLPARSRRNSGRCGRTG